MGEEEFRRAVAEAEILKARLETLLKQQELVGLTLEESLRSKETLTRYREAGPGEELLVPIGANSFLFARVGDPQKAIVGIGSDIAVEDSAQNAIDRLTRQIEELKGALEAIQAKAGELDGALQRQNAKVQAMYDVLQPAG